MTQASNETPRPIAYNDAVDNYLYMLRERGITNMFGASPYLMRDWALTQKDAHACLVYWMHTFSNERAEALKESFSSGSKKRK